MDTTALGIEEEAKLIESAARRKQTELQKQHVKEKMFKIHLEAIERYFMRLSYCNKKIFLLKLFSNVRTADSVTYIMKFMPIGYSKAYYYTSADANMDFYYENGTADHNRMLDNDVIEQQMANDIEWFRLLPDVNQVTLIIALLRLGGGYTRRLVAMPFTYEFFRRTKYQILSQPVSSSTSKRVQIKTSVVGSEDEDKEEDDENCYDPNQPSTIEVEKQRKKWDDIIAKYRREVESLEKKFTIRYAEEKKIDSGKKGSKSKASQKSSKKGKTKKKQDEIDRIQALPVWITKKIFGYLDQKTLKKLKVVNSYWAYIIQDVIGDMKIRKKLNKSMEKIKSQIDPIKLEEALIKPAEEMQIKGKTSRRVRTNYICSAIAKELVPHGLENVTENCLHSDIRNELYAEVESSPYFEKPLLIFPRAIKDDKLYDRVPCFLRDVKVALGMHDGLEKHVSFLTYSLSSRQSSIEFDVFEEDIIEW